MHRAASEIADRVRKLPGVSDVLVPQDVDQPAYRLDIDRDRAAALGLSSKEIVQNVITALTSGGMVAPSYFVDPKNGNDYLLTVQYPEGQVRDLNGLLAIPIRGTAMRQTVRLDSVVSIRPDQAPVEVTHYQLRRVIDVFVAPAGEDLGAVMADVRKVISGVTLPPGIRVETRGMVQGMESSFRSFGIGLILATLLVYLILVAQFQSWIDPILILLAVPMGLTGVLLVLVSTGTTLNVMSLMGVVMMVGIVVSNSILIVEFIKKLRSEPYPAPACADDVAGDPDRAVADGPEVGNGQRGVCTAGTGDHRRTRRVAFVHSLSGALGIPLGAFSTPRGPRW
jgi:multidrug efflux pump subunit AcrB